MQARYQRLAVILTLASGLAAQAQSSPPQAIQILPNPAGPGAMTPQLSQADGRQFMLWQEPLTPGKRRGGLALRFAELVDGSWSEARSLVEGRELLGNWADFPIMGLGSEGQMLASWLARSGAGGHAYGIELASSLDAGQSWRRLGKAHDDDSPSEHGFVSIIPEGTGFRMFWLDGREMSKEGGQMALRSMLVGAGLGPEQVLDADVCSCCQTDAVRTPNGAIVVYRDHLAGEIRDISIIRETEAGWSEPARVADDNWLMPACPVNGPSAAAHGDNLAVAWFTAPEGETRVQLAISADSGENFSAPIVIDDVRPLGRVCLAAGKEGALLGWLANTGEVAVFRLQLVNWQGELGPSMDLASTSLDRASGFPQVLLQGEEVLIAWRDAEGIQSAKTSLAFLRIIPR